MILKVTKDDIKIISQSVENINNAQIILDLSFFSTKLKENLKVYINEEELEHINHHNFKVPAHIYTNELAKITIVIYSGSEIFTINKVFELQKYFSLGPDLKERIPQVIIDINKKIKLLEDRIKELEKERNLL